MISDPNQHGRPRQLGQDQGEIRRASPPRLPGLRDLFRFPDPPNALAPYHSARAAFVTNAPSPPSQVRVVNRRQSWTTPNGASPAAAVGLANSTTSPLVPPEFNDLRRYSLASADFAPRPSGPLPRPSRSSSITLPGYARSPLGPASSRSRRHSAPYDVPRSHTSAPAPSSLAPMLEQGSSNRLHTCDACSYSTRRRHDLQRHRRGHTGERPYPCSGHPFCAESFARSDAKRRHEAGCVYVAQK